MLLKSMHDTCIYIGMITCGMHICTADVLHGHVPRLDLKMSLHVVRAYVRGAVCKRRACVLLVLKLYTHTLVMNE